MLKAFPNWLTSFYFQIKNNIKEARLKRQFSSCSHALRVSFGAGTDGALMWKWNNSEKKFRYGIR